MNTRSEIMYINATHLIFFPSNDSRGRGVSCPVSKSLVTGLSRPTRARVPPCRPDPCCPPSRRQHAQAEQDAAPAPIPSESRARPDFLHTTAKQLTNCHIIPLCNSHFSSFNSASFFPSQKETRWLVPRF